MDAGGQEQPEDARNVFSPHLERTSPSDALILTARITEF